ncbi:MAG: 16S rRNA (cytosine(1402)-N(4))-methyltransferase RsmH [Alphaproteobacteria bacterium]|nr:16S rRNA (cytosine(1402)-N(4))-methyltransferase RsmH [Alphaproteobacteria bacterium]
MSNTTNIKHIPVLVKEVTSVFAQAPLTLWFDGTIGLGGHANALLSMYTPKTYIGCDIDPNAIKIAKKNCNGHKNISYLCASYAQAIQACETKSLGGILLDFGFGSHDLDSGKGFSYMKNEPLLMTYADSNTAELTAAEVVNVWQEDTLKNIFQVYGEEKKAGLIAKKIIEARKKKRISTTGELRNIICHAVGVQNSNTYYTNDPARKVFQALRMVVNQELESMQLFFDEVLKKIEHGGVIATITFHSLEDRLVKDYMHMWKKEGIGNYIVRVAHPSLQEQKKNPRSRSATLRAFRVHTI